MKQGSGFGMDNFRPFEGGIGEMNIVSKLSQTLSVLFFLRDSDVSIQILISQLKQSYLVKVSDFYCVI